MFYKEFDVEDKNTGKFNQEEAGGDTSEEGVEEHGELSTFGRQRDYSSEEGVEEHEELSTFGQRPEQVEPVASE